MLRALSACLLCLALLPLTPASAAADPRLEYIKQHALALYTVSLAQRRQFSGHAMILLEVPEKRFELRRVRVWIDGQIWSDYRYREFEAGLLRDGGGHQLGIVPLATGQHQVRVELSLADDDTEPLDVTRTLDFSQWPLGLHISLQAVGWNKTPELAIAAAVPGALLLRAADFERLSNHPGKSVTILQNLAHVDPAMARQPAFAWRMGRSLRDWGLASAAESIFAEQLESADARNVREEAGLVAAEIALSRGEAAQAARYLQKTPGGRSSRRALLGARSLLAQGDPVRAQGLMPDEGAELWRYNLALALIDKGDVAAGEALLETLSQTAAADDTAVEVRDLASLKLAFRRLERGEAGPAFVALGRIGAQSHHALRGRLARGWAALASAATDLAPLAAEDDVRPVFARRIDAAMRSDAIERPRRITALRSALTEWLPLRDGDPQAPAVQEALVAVPYALSQLGARDRAIEYAEQAVSRISAVREGLRRDLGRARPGRWVNAEKLAATAWPPHPAQWPIKDGEAGWWLAAEPVMPDAQSLPRLIQAPEFLYTMQAMSTLQDVESLLRGTARVPDLKLRSDRLLENLAAERDRQQRNLDRFMLRWLRGEFSQATRYLVMARFTLAQLLEQEAVGAP